jgi:probable HAF family extracellular repeat protein
MADLGTLGGSLSEAHSINCAGQVVGWSRISGDLVNHAFVYSDGVMYDLNALVSLGAELNSAEGINDSGQIIANGSNGHAYLLTPVVPEPSSFVLLGAGLAVLRLARQRMLP